MGRSVLPSATCGRPAQAQQARLGGAVDVGIEDAGLEADGLQAERKVNGRGRLADAALAGGHGDHVLDAGHLLHLPPLAGSRRRCRRGGRPSATPGARLLHPGAFRHLAGPPAAVCAAPARLSAVSTATTPVTPSISRTTFSAAWRMTSSSDARSAGTVIEKRHARPSAVSRTPAPDRRCCLEVGPLDLAQPLEDLFLGKAHLNALRRFAGLRHLPSVGGLSDKPLSRLLL